MSCVSQIQLDANRENARRSTGPQSEQGKAKSSRNATKFGIFSDQVVLPGEDAAAYASFRDGMYARLDPRDELERTLADRVVLAAWKLRRVQAAEAAAFATFQSDYGRWGTGKRSDATPPLVMSCHVDEFERYAKYEAALERSMYRAMAELRRVKSERQEQSEPIDQAGRKNEPISGPADAAQPAAGDGDAVCENEPILAPSPCTRGEGGAEGLLREPPLDPREQGNPSP